MTPQEKAKELAERFRLNVLDYEGCSINSHISKQCALIAVDEIIKHIEVSYHNKDIIKGSKLYWQEVKNEIEKL